MKSPRPIPSWARCLTQEGANILEAHRREAAARDDLVTLADNEGCAFVVADPSETPRCACGQGDMVYGSAYCVEHFHRVYRVVDTSRRTERVNTDDAISRALQAAQDVRLCSESNEPRAACEADAAFA